jgi:AcrR family transcriptional regulator
MSRWKPDAAARLIKAAIALFAEQGYEATTVAEIAERAGLTKRTFFRHFADKREVLFDGSHALEELWLDAVAQAPADASPLATAMAGFDPIAAMFAQRHDFARLRAEIIDSNPELRERELIKLQTLAEAISTALAARGVAPGAALLAAQVGVTVFHVAFANWVADDHPAALRQLMDEALAELRAVISG